MGTTFKAHNKNVNWQRTGHSECTIEIWGFQSLSRTGLLLKNQSVRSVGSLRRMGRKKSWNNKFWERNYNLWIEENKSFPPKKLCIAKHSICEISTDSQHGWQLWLFWKNGLCLVCSRASFSAIASGTHGGSDSNSTCDNCVYWTPINCVCPEIAHTPIHCNYWWMDMNGIFAVYAPILDPKLHQVAVGTRLEHLGFTGVGGHKIQTMRSRFFSSTTGSTWDMLAVNLL